MHAIASALSYFAWLWRAHTSSDRAVTLILIMFTVLSAATIPFTTGTSLLIVFVWVLGLGAALWAHGASVLTRLMDLVVTQEYVERHGEEHPVIYVFDAGASFRFCGTHGWQRIETADKIDPGQ